MASVMVSRLLFNLRDPALLAPNDTTRAKTTVALNFAPASNHNGETSTYATVDEHERATTTYTTRIDDLVMVLGDDPQAKAASPAETNSNGEMREVV